MRYSCKAITCAALGSLSFVSMAGCAVDMAPDGAEEVETAEQAINAYRGVLLIDRTGSMQAVRTATGNMRCEDALAQAKSALNEFYAAPTPAGGNLMAIWTFTNSSVTAVTGYVGKAAALSAVSSLSTAGCDGSTPLADAICKAADTLAALNPKPNALHISTDGGENNSTGPCSGPWGDIYTNGTWQKKVRDKVFVSGLRLDVRFWISPTTLSLLPSVDPETGKPRLPGLPSASASAVCSTEAQCEHLLFSTLAGDTGGVYGVIKDNNQQYPCNYGSCPPPDGGPIYW